MTYTAPLTDYLDQFPGLDQPTRDAVAIAFAVWNEVRASPVLDAPTHWDRFAARIESCAYAPDAPAFLHQVCRRFQVPRPGHAATMLATQLPPDRLRAALRALRHHPGAITDLVRAAKDAGQKLWSEDIPTPEVNR